jgi:hypothetical protein
MASSGALRESDRGNKTSGRDKLRAREPKSEKWRKKIKKEEQKGETLSDSFFSSCFLTLFQNAHILPLPRLFEWRAKSYRLEEEVSQQQPETEQELRGRQQ